MTGVGDTPRTLEEYIRWNNRRVVALERQLVGAGGVDLESRLYPGPGIALSGSGSAVDPMTVGLNDASLAAIAKVPFAEAAGVTASAGAAGGSTSPIFWDGTTTITFPVGRFTVAPIVITEVVMGGNVVWTGVTAINTTVSFVVRLMRVGAAPVAATPIHWRAVQMLPGSAAG